MKKILLASLLLPFFAFKCKKESGDDFLRGKIIRITCADVVVQVFNDNTIGEDGWKNMLSEGAVYDNVFTVANQCIILTQDGAGDIIRFKISNQPQPNNCMFERCMIVDNPPAVTYNISDVSKQ